MNPLLHGRGKKISGIKVMNRFTFYTNYVLSICSLLWAHFIGLLIMKLLWERLPSWQENGLYKLQTPFIYGTAFYNLYKSLCIAWKKKQMNRSYILKYSFKNNFSLHVTGFTYCIKHLVPSWSSILYTTWG